MRRLALAVLALAVLAGTAGCLGSGGVSQDRLAENATYDWNTSANVSVDVATGSYKAVYAVSNTSELSFATPTELSGDIPVSISAVKFRYPNGTVVNASTIAVEQTDSETIVHLPASEGKLAFTAPAGQRLVTIPAPLDGSYQVVLPGEMRVSIPIFGQVTPGGYSREIVDNRVHLRWDSLTASHVEVNYYYQQDVLIYGSVVLLAVLAGIAGALYLRLQIRRLREYREDAGLELE